MKAFRIAEGHSLQFRSEFYNVTNHVNFGLPGSQVGSPNFGRIRGNEAPRRIQLALKYYF
jgi:hypothetical protein